MGILAAFVRKLQTGHGTRVESSLLGAGIDLQSEALTMYYAAPNRAGSMQRDRHVGSWYHDAPYGLYALKDCHIVLSMNDPVKLAAALDNDELRALTSIDRYAERDRYARAVAGILRNRTFTDVSNAFETHGIWSERVQDYEDLRNDPQAIHNGVFGELNIRGKAATYVTHPIRYDGELPACRTIPLEPGADSLAILSELGYGAAEQQKLIECGAVGPMKEAVDA